MGTDQLESILSQPRAAPARALRVGYELSLQLLGQEQPGAHGGLDSRGGPGAWEAAVCQPVWKDVRNVTVSGATAHCPSERAWMGLRLSLPPTC